MNIKLGITATALALAAPAFAADKAATAKVAYGDLDLSSDSGIDRLERRLHRAARQVCGVGSLDLGESQRITACRNQAIAQANEELQPILAAAGRGDVRLAQNLTRSAR
jgi:UrcA family protein